MVKPLPGRIKPRGDDPRTIPNPDPNGPPKPKGENELQDSPQNTFIIETLAAGGEGIVVPTTPSIIAGR